MRGEARYTASMIEIIPTNTCPPDLAELGRRTEQFAGYASHVQLDIDDGKFAPVTSWPYFDGQWQALEEMMGRAEMLPGADRIEYETHLMVEDPIRLGGLLARAGCRRVIPHIEALRDPRAAHAAFYAWRQAGAREIGLAILIDTPLSDLEPLVRECEVVQIMSIATLGAQGAPYDPRATERIAELHAKYPRLIIAVDGGVSEKNIEELARAGTTRFGVGSAISKAPDPKTAYEALKSLAESANSKDSP